MFHGHTRCFCLVFVLFVFRFIYFDPIDREIDQHFVPCEYHRRNECDIDQVRGGREKDKRCWASCSKTGRSVRRNLPLWVVKSMTARLSPLIAI